MRVLLSVYAVSPSRGGEPGNSWKLARGLAERGLEVVVLCTPPADADRVLVDEVGLPLRVLTVGDHVPPVDPTSRIDEYRQYAAWQRQSLEVARQACVTQSFDLVHHYSWGSLAFGSPLWRLGLPMVFGPVGGGAVAARGLRGEFGPLDRLVESVRAATVAAVRWNPRARAVVRRSTVLVNERDTGRLVERLGGGVSVPWLQDTIDPSWLGGVPVARADRRRTVLWAARFLPRKGPTLAVRAFALLPPDVEMTMVGDGPELERSRRLAASLGVADRIRFVGRVPHGRLRELMSDHAVFLFSSLRETFGGQVAEAAACGTPVVAIRQHGVGDHVPDGCGVLVDPGDVGSTAAALADGMVALLDDDDRWAAASSAARSFSLDFSTDRRVEAMLALYERVVSGSSGR